MTTFSLVRLLKQMRLVDLALAALSACVLHLQSQVVYNQYKCNSQVFYRLHILCLLQKVPPTTVAPTYKLTLPSEFVLTHMPDMMAGDFGMISADGTQSFTVSIVPRWAELAHCCAFTVQHIVLSNQVKQGMHAAMQAEQGQV